MKRTVNNLKLFGALAIASIVAGTAFLIVRSSFHSSSEDTETSASQNGTGLIDKSILASQLGGAVRANEFPAEFDLSLDGSVKRTNVRYSLDEAMQARMEKLVGQYSPDYAAFVAMDAKTGRIISMVSYSREHGELDNLTLRATFPAASIFKVVTASAVLDMNKAMPGTIVPFNGANHTLYKKNIDDTRVNRWTRKMTMREAFARSVNTVFGKLGLFVGADLLKNYAERFLFNHPIPADVPVETGYANFSADDPWSVVQAASGFTLDNTMSPLQGALMAAAIANDGVMMEPYLIESLTNESGEQIYQAENRQASIVVEPRSAEKLRELFSETVRSGTSRKAFRQTVRRSTFDDVEFGGKTGSLTGLNPVGKCDWFVGYARYRGQRIAVAALTVNEKKWRVKSSTLANEFLTSYIRQIRASDSLAQHKLNERSR